MSGALIGSAATGAEDRWSDIDLTFAVQGDSVAEILADWGQWMSERFNAVALFDLQHDHSTYRVFLLPNCLEVDLSFTPAAHFGARGGAFTLVFGTASEVRKREEQQLDDLLGRAIHHVLHVRSSIERARLLEAEYWLSVTRHLALRIACMRHGITGSYGKNFDKVPEQWHLFAERALAKSLEHDELKRALAVVVDAVLTHARENERLRAVCEWLPAVGHFA